MIRFVLVLVATLAGGAVRAETIVTSLSTSRVQIGSNFVGDEVVLFGTVEVGPGVPPDANYDVVVSVRGPRAGFVTRRKERVVAFWINVDSRAFIEAPSYLAVLANRPLAQIASDELLRRERVGIAYTVLLQRIGPDFADSVPDDPFRRAFVRLKGNEGLYREDERGVTFLTRTVFRAAIPLPANVPTGNFEVETKLFRGGVLAGRDVTAMSVSKIGFEQFVATAARDHALYYGLAAAGLALLTGWLASLIFRRD